MSAGTGARTGTSSAFTLLEILLALAIASLVLVGVTTLVFSMGELWGRGTDVRLFDLHVRNVTRFLQHELRQAAFPPAARANSSPIGIEEIRPSGSGQENMLTFELPGGSRIFNWPERPLPEVVCSLQVRPNEGLIVLWHSRLEKDFEDSPPRETALTPLATALAYDYYDEPSSRWTTEPRLKMNSQAQPMVPQRLRFTFTYGKLTRESVVNIPQPGQALPAF